MAKKTASPLVGWLGVLMSIITALRSAVLKQGGADEDLHRLATPEGEDLINQMAVLIVGGKPAENRYPVIVDYRETLEQMIAAGQYDDVDSHINETNFPFTGKGKKQLVIELVHFGRDMAIHDVSESLKARGMRPATLPELLAFGSTYLMKGRGFPIVALGTVWDYHGVHRAACLEYDGQLRKLSRVLISGNVPGVIPSLPGYYRFAAIRLPAGQASK